MEKIVALILTLLTGFVVGLKPEDGRVVNGTNAIPGQHPYMVSLKRLFGPHFCGASIVDSSWLMTAAHCVQNMKAEDMEAQYGLTDRWEKPVGLAKIGKVIPHFSYSREDNWANDIALLKLTKPVWYVKGLVEQIPLPTKGFEVPLDERFAILIGWGLNATGGFMQNNLQEAKLVVHTDQDCSRLHRGKTTPKQICCSSPHGGNKECKGDSGGPLVYVFFNVKIIIGVVSWGLEPCAKTGHPGVYTKVSCYIDWIMDTIKTNK